MKTLVQKYRLPIIALSILPLTVFAHYIGLEFNIDYFSVKVLQSFLLSVQIVCLFLLIKYVY